jgi:drug/metabolite transporter (DMT)-like permease
MTGGNHRRGLLITAAGALVLTPDALLLRLAGAEATTAVFWRGVLLTTAMGLGLLVAYRGQFLARLRAIGWIGIAVGFLYGLEATLFVFAISNTSVANTVIIVSTAPLFAASMSWLFLREHIPPRTWAAIAAGLVGIGIVVWDGLELGTGLGDAAALGSGLGFAAALVLVRRARDTDMLPAMSLGGVISAALVLPLSPALALPLASALPLWTTGVVVLPLAFAAFTIGPRHISAAEVGLLMLLQTVLGPVWVWLALGEAMTTRGLIGGGIVVVTLAVHSAVGLRRGQGGS